MSNAIYSLLPQETHDGGCKVFVQLVTHSDQLMSDTLVPESSVENT